MAAAFADFGPLGLEMVLRVIFALRWI